MEKSSSVAEFPVEIHDIFISEFRGNGTINNLCSSPCLLENEEANSSIEPKRELKGDENLVEEFPQIGVVTTLKHLSVSDESVGRSEEWTEVHIVRSLGGAEATQKSQTTDQTRRSGEVCTDSEEIAVSVPSAASMMTDAIMDLLEDKTCSSRSGTAIPCAGNSGESEEVESQEAKSSDVVYVPSNTVECCLNKESPSKSALNEDPSDPACKDLQDSILTEQEMSEDLRIASDEVQELNYEREELRESYNEQQSTRNQGNTPKANGSHKKVLVVEDRSKDIQETVSDELFPDNEVNQEQENKKSHKTPREHFRARLKQNSAKKGHSLQREAEAVERTLKKVEVANQESTVSFLKDCYIDGSCSPEEIMKNVQEGVNKNVISSAIKLSIVEQKVTQRSTCILKDIIDFSERKLRSTKASKSDGKISLFGSNQPQEGDPTTIDAHLSENKLESKSSEVKVTVGYDSFHESPNVIQEVMRADEIALKESKTKLSLGCDTINITSSNSNKCAHNEDKYTIARENIGTGRTSNCVKNRKECERHKRRTKRGHSERAQSKAQSSTKPELRKENTFINVSTNNTTKLVQTPCMQSRNVALINKHTLNKSPQRLYASVGELSARNVCDSHRSMKSSHDIVKSITGSTQRNELVKMKKKTLQNHDRDSKMIDKLTKQESLIMEIDINNEKLYKKCEWLESQRKELQMKLNKLEEKMIEVESENLHQLDKMIRTQSELKTEIRMRKKFEKELQEMKTNVKLQDRCEQVKESRSVSAPGRTTKANEKAVTKIAEVEREEREEANDQMKMELEIEDLKASNLKLEFEKSLLEKQKLGLEGNLAITKNYAKQLERTLVNSQKDMKRVTRLQEQFLAQKMEQKESQLLKNTKCAQTDMISCHTELELDRKLRKIHQKEIVRLRIRIKGLEKALEKQRKLKSETRLSRCSSCRTSFTNIKRGLSSNKCNEGK